MPLTRHRFRSIASSGLSLRNRVGVNWPGVASCLTPYVHITIREMTIDEVERVAALDSKLTGITRLQDLQFFAAQPPQLVSLSVGKLTGYLCLLRAGPTTFLGPAAATEPAILRSLIARAVEMEARQSVAYAVACSTSGTRCSIVLKMGFRVDHLQTYMVRGPWKQPKGTDLLALFPEAL